MAVIGVTDAMQCIELCSTQHRTASLASSFSATVSKRKVSNTNGGCGPDHDAIPTQREALWRCSLGYLPCDQQDMNSIPTEVT